ncbi:MAG: hypothetical protein H0T73_02860 [Ardenticatenales bacterium]|nr:hypothetical protein [Ardenticatenales bacterium]
MNSQFLLVGLSNTIHLLATVIWIGWSALLPLVVAPRALEAHGSDAAGPAGMMRRLTALAYGALAALGATGMLQMGAHPQYEGMFAFTNLWSSLLFVKHLLILASVALIVYLGQSVIPQLRLTAQRAARGQVVDAASLLARFRVLAWLNFLLGLTILALTGLMTALR